MGETIFVMATSGGGLGHLSRALAVAKCLRKKDATRDIIMITSSTALEIIRTEGFPFYYIPSRKETLKKISDMEWMQLMKELFRTLVAAYQPSAVIYDAAYPYDEINQVLEEYHIPKSVWLKRECYKRGLELLNGLEGRFGRVITAKEFQSDLETDTDRKRFVDPIVNLTEEEMETRSLVREKYNVTEKDIFVYVQLGCGNVEKIQMFTRQVLEVLMKKEHVKILLGEYINDSFSRSKYRNVSSVQEYPVARYFKGIDLAIAAAGYNTFHELLCARVPTLFFPNKDTVVDDQCKRAMLAEEKQYALRFCELKTMEENINQLFERQEELRQSLASYRWTKGAIQAADCIIEYLNDTSVS